MNLRKPIALPPALHGMKKPMKMILNVFQKGVLIDGPAIKARRLPDGRMQLKPR
jgi:hypothetical protein